MTMGSCYKYKQHEKGLSTYAGGKYSQRFINETGYLSPTEAAVPTKMLALVAELNEKRQRLKLEESQIMCKVKKMQIEK